MSASSSAREELVKLLTSDVSEAEMLAQLEALLEAHPGVVEEKINEGYSEGELPLHVAAKSRPSEKVLRALLAAYPAGAKEKAYPKECLPLHLAIESKASDEVVLALLEAYPDGAKEKDKHWGRLPLHFAFNHVSYDASEKVVLELLKAYPDGAKEKDKHGNIPIHGALGSKTSEKVVMALQGAYPDGAKEEDEWLRLPIHLAAGREGASEVVVGALLEAYPAGAEEKDEEGKLPIHHAACRRGASEVVVRALLEALLEAHPDGAKEKDKEGKLPIHHAARRRGTSEVVVQALLEALLEAHPNGAKEKDEEGKLPIHYAVGWNDVPEVVVEALLEAYPDCAKEKDEEGRLPIHYAACREDASEVVVGALLEVLLEAHPAGAKEKDEEGKLPIHYAAGWYHVSEVVVGELLEAYRAGAKEKDEEGKLPIHYAISTEGAWEVVVGALLEAHPAGPKEKDEEGKLPIHYAAGREGSSEVVVQTLLEAYPNGVRRKDKYDRLPLHYAVLRNKLSDEVVQALLNEYPIGVRKKDKRGCRPIELAIEEGAPEEVIQMLQRTEAEVGDGTLIIGSVPRDYGAENESLEEAEGRARCEAYKHSERQKMDNSSNPQATGNDDGDTTRDANGNNAGIVARQFSNTEESPTLNSDDPSETKSNKSSSSNGPSPEPKVAPDHSAGTQGTPSLAAYRDATKNDKETLLRGMELFKQEAHFSLAMHKLASVHLKARQFWWFTVPMALITMASGIMAFLATAEMFSDTVNTTLTSVVGSLSFVLVFMQTLSTHSKYDVRGEMHGSTAIDLRDLRDHLKNVVNKTLVMKYHRDGKGSALVQDNGNGGDGNETETVEQMFDNIQKQYNQCLKGCKSTVPPHISDAFGLLDSRLNATLSKSGHKVLGKIYRDYNNVIYFQACDELATRFSCSMKWPLYLPNPNRTVDDTMKNLQKRVIEGSTYWNGGEFKGVYGSLGEV